MQDVMQTLVVLVSLLERVLDKVLFLQTLVLVTFSLENVQVTKTAPVIKANVFLGKHAGCTNCGGNANIFIGKDSGAGPASNSHCFNIYIGCGSGCLQTDGERNIIIGCRGTLPVTDASDQIILGSGHNCLSGNSYFYGCCLGGCVITGIGTNYPNNVVGSATTSKLSVGIVSAYKLYGDGSALTGISGGAGFSPDADENLIAGTCAGGAYDPSSGTSCHNIFLGKCAGKSIAGGCYNVFAGFGAGCFNNTGNKNVYIGCYSGMFATTGCCNVFLGTQAGLSNTGRHNFLAGYQAGSTGSGSGNIAIGSLSLTKICGGCYNIAFGDYAGYCNCSGTYNMFFGRWTGNHGTDNFNNIFMGNAVALQN